MLTDHHFMREHDPRAKEGGEDWTLITTDVERIKKQYDEIRELDFKIFDMNMNILEAKRRVSAELAEIDLVQNNLIGLNRSKQEKLEMISKIAERHGSKIKLSTEK